MTRHLGTEHAEPGLYVALSKLAFTPLSESGQLPGSKTDVYYRVPMIAMFLAAPLLGLAFVVFLPLIGFAMVGYLLASKAIEFAGGAAHAATRVQRPGWEPSLAFLHRSKPAKAAEKPAEPADEWAASIEKKLSEAEHHESR